MTTPIRIPTAIETVPLAALKPSPRNAKTHPEAQVAALAAIIREYGWTVPVVIDADGGIVAGHCRLEAARRLGMEAVPCVRADHLTARQVRALRLADNRVAELGAWDVGAVSTELADLPELANLWPKAGKPVTEGDGEPELADQIAAAKDWQDCYDAAEKRAEKIAAKIETIRRKRPEVLSRGKALVLSADTNECLVFVDDSLADVLTELRRYVEAGEASPLACLLDRVHKL